MLYWKYLEIKVAAMIVFTSIMRMVMRMRGLPRGPSSMLPAA